MTAPVITGPYRVPSKRLEGAWKITVKTGDFVESVTVHDEKEAKRRGREIRSAARKASTA